MIYILGWLLFSSLLLVFTLIRPHPYRFSRFAVFESLLTLIFLNAQAWFRDPFSILGLISWVCLLGSLALALHGFFLLKTRGNPEGDFEDTTTLIKSGAYAYIRHPLYASLLLFGLGAFLKDPAWIGEGLLLIAMIGAVLTADIEEKHNLERFGDSYREYCLKTRRFIPFIY